MRAPTQESVATNSDTRPRGRVSSVVADAQRLIALEIALAKQELKELAVRNAVASALMAVGGLLLVLGVLVAVPVLVVELVPWHWQAAAIWVVAYILVGVLLVLVGKARLNIGLPQRTLESLKENKEWALRHVRSNGR